MGASGVGFHAFLELLPGAEGDHGAGGDRDLLAGLGVAAGALVLAAQVEIAEARPLDLATGLQALAQGVAERLAEFLVPALVQSAFLATPLGLFSPGPRHSLSPSPSYS